MVRCSCSFYFYAFMMFLYRSFRWYICKRQAAVFDSLQDAPSTATDNLGGEWRNDSWPAKICKFEATCINFSVWRVQLVRVSPPEGHRWHCLTAKVALLSVGHPTDWYGLYSAPPATSKWNHDKRKQRHTTPTKTTHTHTNRTSISLYCNTIRHNMSYVK